MWVTGVQTCALPIWATAKRPQLGSTGWVLRFLRRVTLRRRTWRIPWVDGERVWTISVITCISRTYHKQTDCAWRNNAHSALLTVEFLPTKYFPFSIEHNTNTGHEIFCTASMKGPTINCLNWLRRKKLYEEIDYPFGYQDCPQCDYCISSIDRNSVWHDYKGIYKVLMFAVEHHKLNDNTRQKHQYR